MNQRPKDNRLTDGRMLNETALVERLNQQLGAHFQEFHAWSSPDKFSVNPEESFPSHETKGRRDRVKRSNCPGGIGNLGFNSFNFMTFMLMVFNAVANVNNNVNNNNNNNNNVNLNSISQDSNNIISNSDNMNTIMATILPMPGGRKKRSSSLDTFDKMNNKGCESFKLGDKFGHELLDSMKTVSNSSASCEGFEICLSIRNVAKLLSFRDVLVLDLVGSKFSPYLSQTHCEMLFPECSLTL